MTEVVSEKEPIRGGLVIKLTEDNLILVGDVRIYLDFIDVSGAMGGKKVVALRLIGPRSVPIERLNR